MRLLRDSDIKSEKTRDRALMYHAFASAYGWTIDEIDNSPVDILNELSVVLKTLNEKKPKKKPNITNKKGMIRR